MSQNCLDGWGNLHHTHTHMYTQCELSLTRTHTHTYTQCELNLTHTRVHTHTHTLWGNPHHIHIHTHTQCELSLTGAKGFTSWSLSCLTFTGSSGHLEELPRELCAARVWSRTPGRKLCSSASLRSAHSLSDLMPLFKESPPPCDVMKSDFNA